MLTLIFLYTEETGLVRPVGTVHSPDSTGETTECSGSKRDCDKPLQVRVLKRPSLWYIYFYTKEAED